MPTGRFRCTEPVARVQGMGHATGQGVPFWARQRSLQYSTWSQLRAHFLRHVMGLPQTAQGFCGRLALLPRNAGGGGGGFMGEREPRWGVMPVLGHASGPRCCECH